MWTVVEKVATLPRIPLGVLWPSLRADLDCNKLELMEATYEIKIKKKLKERHEEKNNVAGEIYLLLLFKNTLMQLITNF